MKNCGGKWWWWWYWLRWQGLVVEVVGLGWLGCLQGRQEACLLISVLLLVTRTSDICSSPSTQYINIFLSQMFSSNRVFQRLNVYSFTLFDFYRNVKMISSLGMIYVSFTVSPFQLFFTENLINASFPENDIFIMINILFHY